MLIIVEIRLAWLASSIKLAHAMGHLNFASPGQFCLDYVFCICTSILLENRRAIVSGVPYGTNRNLP